MASKPVGEGEGRCGSAARKRIRAADVVLTSTSSGRTTGGCSDGPPTPAVRCTVTPYGLSGQHVSRHFPETGRVWQVQIEHAAKPSITFGILKNWLEFKNSLRRAAGKEDAPTLEGLEKEEGLRLILTGAEDEHAYVALTTMLSTGRSCHAFVPRARFGYKQWQCGFYAHDPAGTGERLGALLHDIAAFVAFARGTASYRNGALPELQWATRCAAVAVTLEDALKESPWARTAIAAHVFDMHPPLGKAGLVLSLEGVPDTDTVNLLFTGNTWPWRAALDGIGVAGGYIEEANGAKTYVRMLNGVRVAEPDDASRLRLLFHDTLRCLPIFLRPVDEEDRGSAAVAATRAWLLGVHHIFER